MSELHPARVVPLPVLLSDLDAYAARGLVRIARDPTRPHLALYCYAQSAVIDAVWPLPVQLARGLVVDVERGELIATPFPKFFNFGERAATIPAEPFEVYEKLDGSLAIIFCDRGRWTVATKGSLTSDQARWAQAWLDARDTSALTPGHTYCAEIIYAANRIVVRYDFEGLVLLAAWDAGGREYDWRALSGVAVDLDARCVERFRFDGFDAMRDAVAQFDSDREGFVVRFASGYRVKVKGAEYLRIHRLVSRVTPLAVWEAMAHSDDLDVIRRDLPEEFWGDFDSIRAVLAATRDGIVRSVADEVARRAGQSDKEVGLSLGALSPEVRPFIFTARRDGATWHQSPKARAALFRMFRPTGNVLPGYAPSGQVARVQEAA